MNVLTGNHTQVKHFAANAGSTQASGNADAQAALGRISDPQQSVRRQ